MSKLEFKGADFLNGAKPSGPDDMLWIVVNQLAVIANRRLEEMLAEQPKAYGDKTVGGHHYFCEDHAGPYSSDTYQCCLVNVERIDGK